MLFRRTAIVAALLLSTRLAWSQAVQHARCGEDHKAHLTFADGSSETVTPAEDQVGCERITVAADRHTVGWSVLVEHCCTSYPIAISVVVRRDKKYVVIPAGQMVWDWHFVMQGEQVAMLSGPVHGNASFAGLYSSRSGKLITSWNGKGHPPRWAEGWQSEFAE